MAPQLNNPIGVFDSGLGGLTIVRQIRKHLPHEKIIYFGDLAQLPYGSKSKSKIIELSRRNVKLLRKHRVKAIVVACNSASSSAYQILKRENRIPIVDVIEPAIKQACLVSKNKKIGVIGTRATIESEAYQKGLKKLKNRIQVFTNPCPLFVPLVEEGHLTDQIATQIAKEYLSPLLKKGIDTLILGCTHYPLLKRTIRKTVGKKVHIIDSASGTVERLKEVLIATGLARLRGKADLEIIVNDTARNFSKIGSRFLGKKIHKPRLLKNV